MNKVELPNPITISDLLEKLPNASITPCFSQTAKELNKFHKTEEGKISALFNVLYQFHGEKTPEIACAILGWFVFPELDKIVIDLNDGNIGYLDSKHDPKDYIVKAAELAFTIKIIIADNLARVSSSKN